MPMTSLLNPKKLGFRRCAIKMRERAFVTANSISSIRACPNSLLAELPKRLEQASRLELIMPNSTARSVFHHDADFENLNELRAAVIQDISFVLATYPSFLTIRAAELRPDELARIRESYSRLLHYGSFSASKTRSVADELIWKWTEATGKYIGCQFWSVKAKEFFDLEVEKRHGGWPISQNEAKALANQLKMKSAQNQRLVHEHVYPIKDMKMWLFVHGKLNPKEIRDHFERQCVACIVLESEHDKTTRGDDENPWLRYKSIGVNLAPNPDWLDTQRALIDQAGLLNMF